MTRSICELLREKIRDFVSEKNESLRWFSRQADVDYTTIYRLNSGEQKRLSFLNAYRILKVISPAGYLAVLGDFYPDEVREVAGTSPSSIDKRAAIAESVLKDYLTFKVYTYASTSPRVNREKVALRFGYEGIERLENLINMTALSEEDGIFKDNLEGEVLLSIEAIKKTGQFTIEAVNLSEPGSVMENIRASLSPEGHKKWFDAVMECRAKLHEIAASEKGEVAAVATLLAASF